MYIKTQPYVYTYKISDIEWNLTHHPLQNCEKGYPLDNLLTLDCYLVADSYSRRLGRTI